MGGPPAYIALGAVLLFAMLLLANGIYILVKGRMGPPLSKRPQPGTVLPNLSRISLAVFYFTMATVLMLLVCYLASCTLSHQ